MLDGVFGAGRVVQRYEARVASGELQADPAQLRLAARFDALSRRLDERRLASKGRALGWLFGGRDRQPTKGLYVHGAVGRGKTMLMDTFFAIGAAEPKCRTHFHEFMSDVHERIHDHRQAVRAGATSEADPIRPVATAIASETRLLCLDEFAVADVADAMILSRLFERLFAEGLVLVATSNTAPDDLYRDGLNRPLFMPFVALLRQHAEIIDLKASIDYRLKKLAGTPIYVTPLGAAADGALDALWLRLTGAECGPPAAIMAKGREIRIPQAAEGVARFEFADLCDAPLGAADYARIARAFHTVMIDHVRVLAEGERNTARRLINLIDTLYDHRTKLVASAAAEPQALYTASRGAEIEAFARTASRLVEMRSAEYLGAPRCATEMAEVDPG